MLVGYLFHAKFAHQTCGTNGDEYAEYVQEDNKVFWGSKRLCGLFCRPDYRGKRMPSRVQKERKTVSR
jgi:hypothetical protein